VVDSRLNITAAATRMHSSQPGISRQLRLLEEELGLKIFVRQGRALARLTPAGAQVIEHTQRVLDQINCIKGLSVEIGNEDAGSLSIATTHTQARYVLPPVISHFRERYPEVKLHLHQGTSEQIAEQINADRVDLAIASGHSDLYKDLTLLPCYRWHRTIIVPRAHPLAGQPRPTLADLAHYPLITYTFSVSGPSSLHELFAGAGLEPNVVLTARDADVIKTYVRIGLGVGIVASVAVDAEADPDLVAIDAAHLFPTHTTWLGVRRATLLRRYMYDFIRLFAPHLDRRRVDDARDAPDAPALEKLFSGVALPQR